ncbi:MAG: hypothetical protein OXH09_16630 [Gammaproteobacteria bacterium]|nr:hypothetical protein [Gammaproteobacteria bacterium]
MFIDQVNDYYDDFTANVERPYEEWRREAFHGRRARRELSAKADAQMLLGSARIIEGLARMEHGEPSRLVVDWVTRGLGLIRGAGVSEEQMRETVETMRQVGRSTEATLSRSRPKAVRIPGVKRLQPVEKAMAYQLLARAYLAKKDYEAAIGVYEGILDLGTRALRWHFEISNGNLAMIHFSRRDFEKSLNYQKAWLETSSWVGEACPRVCPAPRVDSPTVKKDGPVSF